MQLQDRLNLFLVITRTKKKYCKSFETIWIRKLSLNTEGKIILSAVKLICCVWVQKHANIHTMLNALWDKYPEAMRDTMIVAKFQTSSWNASTKPTAWSSRSSKILERMRRRSGTVMMRTKGNAREAAVDFTTHSATMHASWMMVNMFIRQVFTWGSTHMVVIRLKTNKL